MIGLARMKKILEVDYENRYAVVEPEVVEITRRWLELSKSGRPSGPQPAVNWLLVDEEARRWWQRRRSIQLPEPAGEPT